MFGLSRWLDVVVVVQLWWGCGLTRAVDSRLQTVGFGFWDVFCVWLGCGSRSREEMSWMVADFGDMR